MPPGKKAAPRGTVTWFVCFLFTNNSKEFGIGSVLCRLFCSSSKQPVARIIPASLCRHTTMPLDDSDAEKGVFERILSLCNYSECIYTI